MAREGCLTVIIIAFIFILIYSAILLWFYTGLNAKSIASFESNNYSPMVSVVVAARNEENNLAPLLLSLCQQNYPQNMIEIIIANDRSTDRSADIIHEFKNKNSMIKMVSILETPVGWAPKKWALNCAIRASGGEIILFTDADCIPSNSWVSGIVQEFSDPAVGFVSAPAPLTSRKEFIDEIFLLDSLTQDGFSAGSICQGIPLSCTGRNMAIRKTIFDEVGGYKGFQNIQSGDDDLLLQKVSTLTSAKINFRMNADAMVYSSPPQTVNEFIQQRLRFASKGISYYKLNTTLGMKLILPLLYITNIIAVIAIFTIIQGEGSRIVPLLLLGLKSISDGIYSYKIFRNLKIQWPFIAFLILTILHPIYVVAFGAMGPFSTIRWKTDD
ncbi:MAG: glycosyltransferase [Fidelibacterota bacterium]